MGLIRLLLALSVLVGHARGLPGLRDERGDMLVLLWGDVAVQSFYIISGFYMAFVLDRVYPNSTKSPWAFWLSRYLRLAPLYLLVSALTALTWFVHDGSVRLYSEADSFSALLAVISNVTLIGQDVFMFFAYDTTHQAFVFMPDILQGGLARAGAGTHEPGWGFLTIEQGWSIGVELWFYLLAPFILRRPTVFLCVLAAASLGLRIVLAQALDWRGDPWSYRFFPSELMVFLAGSLAYRAYRARWLVPNHRALQGLAFAVVLALILLYPIIPGPPTGRRWGFELVLALCLPAIFALTRDIVWDRRIGELSYPVYLIHLLILYWLPGELGGIRGYYALAVTLVASALAFAIIDRPMDRIRHRLAQQLMPHRRVILP